MEPDSEEVFEELRQREYHLLIKRNRFQDAVNRKGTLQVDLSKEAVNEIKIELTSL
ncbi:MAG: hypothetical protein O2955_16475 [Planctomycetota bacterium]|nr:hypothetical protein [Planctomycetota bacterium]MDA1214109.1 hypothetical protein [Planctomycetota bacterium]